MKFAFQQKWNGLRARWSHYRNNQRLIHYARAVKKGSPASDKGTVILFNASTRIAGLSLNAAYSLLTGWMLALDGYRVVKFICEVGMSQCVLGTDRDDPHRLLPCATCGWQSSMVAADSATTWFGFDPDPRLANWLEQTNLTGLQKFSYNGVPLGELVLPSLRWVQRRHHLIEDETTLYLYRQFVISAWNVYQKFQVLLKEEKPSAVIVFNGMFFPEALARWACRQAGIRCISHEVGLLPHSAFFTDGDATAYPINIPTDFVMGEVENAKLDAYLQKRMQGNFSMAGIRFWPEMQPLSAEFWQHAAQFGQIVPIFTNVIFDTSQSHANTIFADMFEWLNSIKKVIDAYPRTLFVIRAHPDESRPGKASRQSVTDWVQENKLESYLNVLFVPPQQYFSSYELITKSKLVLVYNSTIGLEAAIMGTPVLAAGKARYTQLPTVFLPDDRAAYERMLTGFLLDDQIEVPEYYRENARKFLYYQLFKTSLPFEQYLKEDGIWPGYVNLRQFGLDRLKPENSTTVQAFLTGLEHGKEFLRP